VLKIYPSLIAGNLLAIQDEIVRLEPYCDGFHVDVMDFHFVPNLTFGADTVNAIAAITQKPLSVHLMVDDPAAWIKLLKLRPQDTLSFHYEATENHQTIINAIQQKGWRAGIAINPASAVEQLYPLLADIDQVLVMSVQAGFSGQQFIPHSLDKLKELSAYKQQHNLPFIIAIDGGVNGNNIADVAAAGAQEVVVGSALFNAVDVVTYLQELYTKSQS